MELDSSKSLKKIIISRGRADRVKTFDLVPDATLVVPDVEVEEYALEYPDKEIIAIPSSLYGISKVRNWVIQNFDEEVILMFDDDIIGIQCMAGPRSRKMDNETEVPIVIGNLIQCAIDAEVSLFGLSQNARADRYSRNEPIALNKWVGGVVGVIGKDVLWDERLTFKCDVDVTLSELMRSRIVYTECRFAPLQQRDTNIGGNSIHRTKDRIEKEKEYLGRKWGDFLSLTGQSVTQEKIAIKVKRRAPIGSANYGQ